MNVGIVIGVSLLFVVLTVLLAKRKHRNLWLWGVNAFFGVIATLIALAFFGDLQTMSPEDAKRSLRREKIVSVILIVLGFLKLLNTFGIFH